MQGEFPSTDTKEDGYDAVSPVDAFPMQNKYGNFYYQPVDCLVSFRKI